MVCSNNCVECCIQEGTEEEVRLRVQVSTVVQLLLMALESSHTALPAARWYYQMVVKAVDKARLAFVSVTY